MRGRGLAILLAATLAGCTVGPDHRAPDPTLPEDFAEAQAGLFDGAASPGTDLWTAFDDPDLERLIELALAQNRGLAQALAQLEEARAIRGLERYALYPIVTASADAERSRPSAGDPFIPAAAVGVIEIYRAGFDASWEIDLFGRARRAREAARAEVDAAVADLRAVRLALVAEVAQSYLALRAEQARLAVQRRQVDNLRDNLRLLELLRDEGRGTQLDVARSNALGLAVASQVPQTEAAIARQEQRLAVLTGQPVAELRDVIAASRPLPKHPEFIPVGTPEEWLRRRPDVAAAEHRLASAVARVGVEVADFFPRLDLIGGFGWTGGSLGDIGDSNADRWRVGPVLNWSFLDFGRVRQQVLAAEARADGALAAYEEAVLLALEEVEIALANYRADDRTAATLEQAVARASEARALAQLRFEAGAIDNLELLDAERTQLDLEDQLATASSRRATSLAALYKALAGDFAAPSP